MYIGLIITIIIAAKEIRVRGIRVNDDSTTYSSTINDVSVLENSVDDGRIREDYETKASRSAGGLVSHDNGLSDVTVLAEVVS